MLTEIQRVRLLLGFQVGIRTPLEMGLEAICVPFWQITCLHFGRLSLINGGLAVHCGLTPVLLDT
jgi:hypothetical protein